MAAVGAAVRGCHGGATTAAPGSLDVGSDAVLGQSPGRWQWRRRGSGRQRGCARPAAVHATAGRAVTRTVGTSTSCAALTARQRQVAHARTQGSRRGGRQAQPGPRRNTAAALRQGAMRRMPMPVSIGYSPAPPGSARRAQTKSTDRSLLREERQCEAWVNEPPDARQEEQAMSRKSQVRSHRPGSPADGTAAATVSPQSSVTSHCARSRARGPDAMGPGGCSAPARDHCDNRAGRQRAINGTAARRAIA